MRTFGWANLFRVLRPVLIAYLLVVLLMTFIESWLVYPAPPTDSGDWHPPALGHQDVSFEAADGTRLHGWLLEHPDPQHVVVYFHGNGEHVAYNADLLKLLHDRLDATVLLFDYRGYGKSEGRPNEPGLVADGLAAHRWLADRAGVATAEVVLIGRSLGGAVAVASAAELGAKALVLQNTFASLVDTAAQLYPWLPVRLVMRNRYDSIDRIAAYHGPVLQCHGTADRIVPYEQGRRLFAAVPGQPAEWVDLEGQDHNSPMPMKYYEQLRAFLDRL